MACEGTGSMLRLLSCGLGTSPDPWPPRPPPLQGYPIVSVDTDARGRVHLRQAPFRLNATLDCATTQTFWIPIRRAGRPLPLLWPVGDRSCLAAPANHALPAALPLPRPSHCSYVTSSAPDELKWTVLSECSTKDPFFVL